MIQKISEVHQLNQIIQTNSSTLVMFTASWCGPCKIIKPIIYIHSDDAKYSKIAFVEVDIDYSDELQAKYDIKSLPTFIMLVDGIERERITGVQQDKIKMLLNAQI